MSTNPDSDIASRAALKKLFADGERPRGADFGTLIDSFVHRDDVAAAASSTPAPGGDPSLLLGNRTFTLDTDQDGCATLAEQQRLLLSLDTNGRWRVPAGSTGMPLAVDGWLGSAARIGTYPAGARAATGAAFPSGDTGSTQKVPANGQWQVVLPALNGCHAFEIVAHASGTTASGRHAMLHAIVLTSFNGDKGALRITRTERGWGLLRRLQLRWKPRRVHWWSRPSGYDLEIRTRFGYGVDDVGQPAQLGFHVTRLW